MSGKSTVESNVGSVIPLIDVGITNCGGCHGWRSCAVGSAELIHSEVFTSSGPVVDLSELHLEDVCVVHVDVSVEWDVSELHILERLSYDPALFEVEVQVLEVGVVGVPVDSRPSSSIRPVYEVLRDFWV